MSPRRHKLADALAQRPGLDRDPGPERGHSFLLAPGERHIAIHRFVSLPYLRPQSSMAAQPTASSGTRGLSFAQPCAPGPAVSLPISCPERSVTRRNMTTSTPGPMYQARCIADYSSEYAGRAPPELGGRERGVTGLGRHPERRFVTGPGRHTSRQPQFCLRRHACSTTGADARGVSQHHVEQKTQVVQT